MASRLDILRRTAAVSLALGLVLAAAQPSQGSVPPPQNDPLQVDLARLTPTPGRAKDDVPPIHTGSCDPGSSTAADLCRFGDPHGSKVMVAIGDSHMAQWFSAVNRTARRDGFRLLWATRRGCPAATVTVRSARTQQPYLDCDVWRSAVLEKVASLRRVDLVVMSSSHWATLLQPGTDTEITAGRERRTAWHAGMKYSIRAVVPTAKRILVIRDTPRLGVNAPACLLAGGGDTRLCSQSRSLALKAGPWRAERELTSDFARVTVAQFTSAFCSPRRCRPVTEDLVLRFRDGDHLTNTFASKMSGRMDHRIHAALA